MARAVGRGLRVKFVSVSQARRSTSRRAVASRASAAGLLRATESAQPHPGFWRTGLVGAHHVEGIIHRFV